METGTVPEANPVRVLSFLVLVAVATRGTSAELGVARPPAAESGMLEAADLWDGTQGFGDGDALIVDGTKAPASVARTFPVEPDSSAVVSFQYRCSHLNPYMKVIVHGVGDGPVSIPLRPKNHSWTAFAATVQPVGTSSIRVEVAVGKTGVCLALDDWQVTEHVPRIANGSFSLGRKYWRFQDDAATIDDGTLRLLGGRTETVVKDIVPGCDYRFVGRVAGTGSVRVRFLDAYDTPLPWERDRTLDVAGKNGGWASFSRTLHVPLEAVWLQVALTGGQVRFDDLALVPAGAEEDE